MKGKTARNMDDEKHRRTGEQRNRNVKKERTDEQRNREAGEQRRDWRI